MAATDGAEAVVSTPPRHLLVAVRRSEELVAEENVSGAGGSWRLALAPGESHGFYETPGWWDLRDVGREDDDVPRLRAALLRALPPLPDGSAVLDLAAGTGTLVASLARFYPRLHYTLLDANPAALERAAEKLRTADPDLRATFVVEVVDPLADGPLVGEPYRLVVSSIALHDIARPAAPDDGAGRVRHAHEHRSLLRRILVSLEPGGHFVYGDAMRPRFRVMEHLAALDEAGFVEVDCAYVVGRFLVCGGRR
jgi:SAM-dependent methyltransferase